MSSSYPSLAWPPKTIPAGSLWTKDNVDTTTARAGGTLPKYKATLNNSNAFYGKGQYTVFANTLLSLGQTDEWPPSGAFDKLDAVSNAKTGWHTGEMFMSSGSDASPAALLYIVLPEQIALQSYTLKARTDCCASQNPSAWQVHGSGDGTNWTLVDSRTGQTGSAIGSSRDYTVSSTSYYNNFRFSILRNSSATTDWMHIGEVFLFGRSSTAMSMSNALSYGKSSIFVGANGNGFSSFRGLGGIASTGVLSFSTISSQLSLASIQTSPSSISGLGLWLDATDYSSFTFSGSNVTQWNDKSGNSRHFANATTSTQPTYESSAFNSKPCINLAGGKGLSRAATSMGTLASSATMSAFVVAETSFTYSWNITLTNWFDVNGNGATTRFHFSLRDNATNTSTLYANAALQGSTGTTADNTRYVQAFVYGGSGVTSYLSLNGVATTFTPNANLTSSSGNASSVFFIGDIRTSLISCKRIAEIVIYDRALTVAERQSIENYLRSKYSI